MKEGRSLQATSRGRVLSAFLQHYFARYVDYGFTSNLESQLDEIAGIVSLLDMPTMLCVSQAENHAP